MAGLGFGAALLLVLGYVADVVPGPLLVAVFVPLAVGFEWGLQAYTSFCVRLALVGRYDLRGDGGDAGEVSDPSARRDDRLQAAKITCAAVLLAGVTTGLLVALLL